MIPPPQTPEQGRRLREEWIKQLRELAQRADVNAEARFQLVTIVAMTRRVGAQLGDDDLVAEAEAAAVVLRRRAT
jgi:hypothetical protein